MKFFKNLLLTKSILKKKRTLLFLTGLISTFFVSSEKAIASYSATACDTLTLPTTLGTDETNLNKLNPIGGEEYGCTISPNSYIVKAHEVGICKADSNPFSLSALDTSGCAVIWSSNSGELAELVSLQGSPAVYPLSDEDLEEKPPVGSYKYGYIIIDDSIQIKATLNLKDAQGNITETWHTTDGDLEYTNTNRDQGYNASLGKKTGEAELVPTRFGYFYDTSNAKVCSAAGFPLTDGSTISALLLNSDKKTRSTKTDTTNNFGKATVYCAGATYIGGVQTFDTPLEITEATSSFTISFDTTDSGAHVSAYNYESKTPENRPYFDVGPFIIKMSVR